MAKKRKVKSKKKVRKGRSYGGGSKLSRGKVVRKSRKTRTSVSKKKR